MTKLFSHSGRGSRHLLVFATIPLLLIGGCSSEAGFDWVEGQALPLTTGQLNGNSLPAKTVVFTYDDGPDEHTLELARYLKDEGIKATFFVNGRRFCKEFDAAGTCITPQETRTCQGAEQARIAEPILYPESLLDELLALGHRIGNHTQDHCHLGQQTNAENLIFELRATEDILTRHVCDGVSIFRAPYGEWSGTVLGRLNTAMGFDKIIGPVNWDVDGGDWECWQKGTSPEACANQYLSILNRRSRQNGIFLMHDRPEFNVTYEGPLLMAKILVSRLKADGFTFASLDEALDLKPQPSGMCPRAPVVDGGAADGGGMDTSAADAEPGGTMDAGQSSEPTGSDAASAAGGSGGSGGGGGNSGSSAPPPSREGGAGGAAGGGAGSAGSGSDNSRGPRDSGGGCSFGGQSKPAGFGLFLLVLGFLGRRRASASARSLGR